MVQPYFETIKSFADIPISEEGIDTRSFLEASDGLVHMFDLFGSVVFGFVQSDLRGNIAGVRKRHEAIPDSSNTLESLLRKEASLDSSQSATPCLIRLMRGLSLTCRALQKMQADPHCELNVCFKSSYDAVLSHHHSFLIRSVVAVAIRAVPRRNEFYACLAQGGSLEQLDAGLARWLDGLGVIVKRFSAFIEEGKYGKV